MRNIGGLLSVCVCVMLHVGFEKTCQAELEWSPRPFNYNRRIPISDKVFLSFCLSDNEKSEVTFAIIKIFYFYPGTRFRRKASSSV